MSEEQKKPKGLEVGPPMWVESLLNRGEWFVQSKKYPQTYNENQPPDPLKFTVFWRIGMGANLTSTEITNINNNIDHLLKTNKL